MYVCMYVCMQARSQPARWGGLNLDGWNTRRTPPLGHCPRDVIRPPKNWKTPPSWTFTSTPPPLDIARVTSSTYSKGGTKLLKGGTKLLKGGTKLLLKGGTKLLKGGTKSLGWATGGGRPDPPPPRPPPPPGYGPGMYVCVYVRACVRTYMYVCIADAFRHV